MDISVGLILIILVAITFVILAIDNYQMDKKIEKIEEEKYQSEYELFKLQCRLQQKEQKHFREKRAEQSQPVQNNNVQYQQQKQNHEKEHAEQIVMPLHEHDDA